LKSKTSQKQEEILVRRSRIAELYSKGMSERSIAKQLDIPRSTINLDVRRKALTYIKTFEERLPYEYESMIAGVRLLLKKNWEILDNEESSDKAVASAAHIILTCYEKLSEQLKDEYEIMDGMNGAEGLEPELTFKDRATQEAYERDKLNKGRVF
jgi:hypothetical protein